MAANPDSILQAVNKVLREALACESAEDLGRTCLEVAEDLTESKFGFIGEINHEGKLDVIAISDPDWNLYKVDPWRRDYEVPTGFTVHGIYGGVPLDGQSFFTNDPASHPDSIGLPEGHPPLTSFLGVPLVQARETVGVIGLGNREGGYGQEHLEAVEALAPSIVQVLMRKRVEDALKESEARARALITYAPTGIYEIDYRFPRFVTVNEAMCQLSGYSREELLAMNPTDILDDDGKKLFAERIARQLAGERISEAVEFRVRRKDGSFIYVSLNIALSTERPHTALVIGHDITERKRAEAEREQLLAELETTNETLGVQNEELRVISAELQERAFEVESKNAEIQAALDRLTAASEELKASEERFRVIFEQTAIGMAELGLAGQVLRANPRLCQIMGYAEAELASRRFHSFTHPEDLQRELIEFSRMMDGEIPSYSIEKRLVRKDGSLIWTAATVSPIRDLFGEIAKFILAVEDISGQKEAEAERERLLLAEREARELAESAVKVRDEFISIAAHELKTPVTSIRGFAQALLRKHSKNQSIDLEQSAQILSVIDRQTKRLSALTEELLNVSRLEAGQLRITREEVDASELIDDALASICEMYPASSFQLRSSVPAKVLVDPLRIEQVLVNLLDNAAKFSPRDRPVEVMVAPLGEDSVVVSVRDYGRGLAGADKEKVFERFYQAHPERHYGGMGLGLFICRSIVEAHGGRIWVESEEGEGSTFRFTIPLAGKE